MNKIKNTGIVQGVTDVIRHTYHWGREWPQETAKYSNIDSHVIRDGDTFQVTNDEGIPVLYHRALHARSTILGAYSVATIRQSGVSVFMVVSIETLDNVAERYLWTANHRLGMTREDVLEETVVRIFLSYRGFCFQFA